MPQVLGRATIKWDGNTLETAKGASLDLGGTKQNTVIYGRKIGYAEETVPALVECQTALEAGMSLDRLRAIRSATITFLCDTGQTYTVRDAYLTDPVKLKDGNGGEVELKFAGQPADESI